MNLLEIKATFLIQHENDIWEVEYSKASNDGWNVDISKNNKSIITKAWVSERKGISIGGAKALVEVTSVSIDYKLLRNKLND